MKKKNFFKDLNILKGKKSLLVSLFDGLNENKLFVGLMMIFMNLGSRYIDPGLTDGQKKIFKSVAKELLIFTIAFVATRNILVSLTITILFIIFFRFVFNENCKYNLIPEKMKSIMNSIDLDGDGKISQEEMNKALEILDKAKLDSNIKDSIKKNIEVNK